MPPRKTPSAAKRAALSPRSAGATPKRPKTAIQKKTTQITPLEKELSNELAKAKETIANGNELIIRMRQELDYMRPHEPERTPQDTVVIECVPSTSKQSAPAEPPVLQREDSGAPWPTLNNLAGENVDDNGENLLSLLSSVPCSDRSKVFSLTSSSLSIHAHVSQSVREKVWSKELFDLSLLNTKHSLGGEEYILQVNKGQSGTDGPCLSATPRVRSKIETFADWQRLWEVYMSVYILKPDLAPEASSMLKYLQTVRDIADNRGDWKGYDIAFRSVMATEGWNWAYIPAELWMKACRPVATGRHLPFRGGKSSRYSSNSGASGLQGVCYKYNQGTYHPFSECPYIHVCRFCKGKHPGSKCLSKSSSESGQESGSPSPSGKTSSDKRPGRGNSQRRY